MGVYVHTTAGMYGQTFSTREAAETAADRLAERGVTPRPGVEYRSQTVPRHPAMPSTAYRYALAAGDRFTDPREARAYADARERGETPSLALYRARVESACRAVLAADYDDTTRGPYSDPAAAYSVDVAELARVSGEPWTVSHVRNADGSPLDPRPIVLPDGSDVRVFIYADTDTTPDDVDCYDADAVQAWRDDRWRYVGVSAVVTLPDGRVGQADVWGVESGDYWPGSDEADIWHTVLDLIREAHANALDTPIVDPRAREHVADADALDRLAEVYRTADVLPDRDEGAIADAVREALAATGREVTA